MKRSIIFVAGLLIAVGCADPSGAGGTTVGSAAATTSGATTGAGGSTSTSGAGGSGSGADDMNDGGRDAGTGGDATSSGAGGSPSSCNDMGTGESNDTMNTATELAGGSDCDDLSTQGTIDGADDIDWYVYHQTDDEALCNVNPARDWSVQAGHTLRVCKFVACQVDGMSPDTVNCNDGSTEATHDGLEGCCDTEAPFDVGIGFWGCEGSTDLVTVYTSVEEVDAEPDACTHYNLNYTF